MTITASTPGAGPQPEDEPVSSALLLATLADLDARGAYRFDPIRYRTIVSLADKADQQKASVALRLRHRARQLLEQYQADLALAESAARIRMQSIEESFPSAYGAAKECVERFDFRGLRRLQRRLSLVPGQNSDQGDSLAALITTLRGEDPAVDKQASGLGFDEYLQQQDSELMLGLESPVLVPEAPIKRAPELRSARQLRQLQIREKAERLVHNAIKESPASPGPLNPQMLAIRALKGMRDLSPQYLNRLVTYIDSLLWVEKAGARYAPEKRSKKSAKLRPAKGAS